MTDERELTMEEHEAMIAARANHIVPFERDNELARIEREVFEAGFRAALNYTQSRLTASEQEERVTLEQHARVIEAMADEELRRKAAEQQCEGLRKALAELVRLRDRQDAIGPASSDRVGLRGVAREIAEVADAWIAARAALTQPPDTPEE